MWRDQARRLQGNEDRESEHVWHGLSSDRRDDLREFVAMLGCGERRKTELETEALSLARKLFVPEKIELVRRSCVALGYVRPSDIELLANGPVDIDHDPLGFSDVAKTYKQR